MKTEYEVYEDIPCEGLKIIHLKEHAAKAIAQASIGDDIIYPRYVGPYPAVNKIKSGVKRKHSVVMDITSSSVFVTVVIEPDED